MRILDRVAAGVLAAVVAALGVVAVIEIVYAAVGDGRYLLVDWPTAVDALARNSWSDTGPLVFGGVATALGVLLCTVALRRGRFARLPAQSLNSGTFDSATAESGAGAVADASTTTFVRRKSLARVLGRAAESVDGVTSARVHIGRRKVTARVSLRLRTSTGAAEEVADVVGRTLTSFALARTPPLTVRASRGLGRGRRRRPGDGPPRDEGFVVGPGTAPGAGTRPGPGTSSGFGTGTGTGTGTEETVLYRDLDQRTPVRRGRRRRPFAARVERLDRALLTLLGLVLVGGGAVVLLAGLGAFGTETENAAVLTADYRSFAADHGWFWPVVGVGAGLVAVAALAWLVDQFSTGRLRRLAVTYDEIGSAYVEGPGLARAVADDACRRDGVRHARARLHGTASDPLVRLVLTTEPEADVASTRRFTETEVLGRARHALGRPDLHGQVELEPTAEPARRAR